jgi:redox-sensitive bicupin YhaK (pirin superfamily)
MGNTGVIGAGDVQWMTAGSGVIHQEMPKMSPTGTMWGFQFWANLPASRKMMAPRYRDVRVTDIPEVELDGAARVKIIAGEIADVKGPVRDIVIEPEMLDVSIPPGKKFTHNLPAGHTAFAYVLSGEGYFDDCRDAFGHEMAGKGWWDVDRPCTCPAESVVLFEHAGEAVKVETADKAVRFLFVSGRPLNEPVAWYGPIVMNTQEELRKAFEEFKAGTFIK